MESVCKKVRTDLGTKSLYAMYTTTMSDNDSSDASNMSSPKSYIELLSPHSSPSQQVPNLTKNLIHLNCSDGFDKAHQPYLRVVEQPQDFFRFRYKSEMVGTHGCLLGKSYSTQKIKTHPTVELMNYNGCALIRCRLAQSNYDKEHPHKLLDEDQEREVSKIVPEDGIYKVAFPGLGIIHTAKKEVPKLLCAKYAPTAQCSQKELNAICENEAKTINLNIVRLMFSAHDLKTGKEICRPVYSEQIHNLKSAATNDLKICRISKYSGRPSGGDDVYLLVEKVNKKNIEVRFVEYTEDGEEFWSAKASFLQTDVHHQYAIVCRTPAYRDPKIPSDVKVKIQLTRPSDGKFSEPKEFTYKAEPMYRQSKKRKANSSYSSLTSSGSSMNSLTRDLPPMVSQQQLKPNYFNDEDENMTCVGSAIINSQNMLQDSTGLEDALYHKLASPNAMQSNINPLLSQPNTPAPPLPYTSSITALASAEIAQYDFSMDDKILLSESDLKEYFKDGHGVDDMPPPGHINGIQLIADSGRKKNIALRPGPSKKQADNESDDSKESLIDKYDAQYNPEDGAEVRKLVAEICQSIKTKGSKKQDIRKKVTRLFDMRLSNGDAFLHMTLFRSPESLKTIVTIIASLQMTHLLNLRNTMHYTVLHLAIMNDMPDIVTLLISKGADPKVTEPEDDNNLVHFAVMYPKCLEALLAAIKKYFVQCDLNAFNREKQTALHLAAVRKSAQSTRVLLKAGASYSACDIEGRTPLHLAAYDDSRDVVAALLEHIPPSDIDAVDGTGNTALQIVCGSNEKENTIEILELLLKHKADPLKRDNNDSAWKLVRDKPKLLKVMEAYVSDFLDEDDIKSEPDDDYESADDGEDEEYAIIVEETDVGLYKYREYEREVCAALDAGGVARGAWRELAERLHHDALLSWFANTPSPAATLLKHIRETDSTFTSKSLALILEDMGLKEAAAVIRRYIE